LPMMGFAALNPSYGCGGLLELDGNLHPCAAHGFP
jgi:hypothetical protein